MRNGATRYIENSRSCGHSSDLKIKLYWGCISDCDESLYEEHIGLPRSLIK